MRALAAFSRFVGNTFAFWVLLAALLAFFAPAVFKPLSVAIVPLLGYLHRRPWLAALFGAIGGPLAYLGAARGWDVVQFAQPQWHSLLALAAGWAVAMPLLAWLARRGLQSDIPGGAA